MGLRVALMITISISVIKDINPAHIPTRPIYEATEEVTPLLGNPLGGGSPEIVKRNTMMHVRNQRKIFDIEMVERRKAQQLLAMEPQDSYLRAYHEQHEQFHMDLEQKMLEQMAMKENYRPHLNATKSINYPPRADTKGASTSSNFNQLNRFSDPKTESSLLSMESIRNKRLDIDRIENVGPTEKTARSIEYAPGYFLPMKQQSQDNSQVYTKHVNHETARIIHYTPSKKFKTEDVSTLTSAALRGSDPFNQYSQLSGYKNLNGDVDSLTALIGKEPEDQLKGLSYLLQGSTNHKVTSLDLKNAHINLKASAIDVPEEFYEKTELYGSNPTPLNSYQKYVYTHYDGHAKDHTPITENVDDVADTELSPTKYTPLPTSFTYVTDVPYISTISSNFENKNHGAEYETRGSLYEKTPNYSYTSGHDNVSIEVKDKVVDDSDNSKNIKTINDNNDTYNKTIPFGAKLRPKNVKNTARVKRDSNHNNRVAYLPSHVNTNNQFPQSIQVTHPISNTQQNNFTHSQQLSTKLKTSIVNSFSPKDLVNSTTPFSNHILHNLSSQINCSECFKSNGDSEFYYYEDSSENETDASNININDDFPSYDDDLQSNNTSKSKLTLKSLNNSGGRSMSDPHSEALRLRFMKRPKLYRLLNGIKTRVMSPNPSRYRKYLVRKPVRHYYSRYADDFNNVDPRLKMYEFAASNNYYDQMDYGYDYNEDYYEDDEAAMYDDLGSFKFGRRPQYDPYEDYASQTQYASGFNYQDDYISIDTLQRNNRNNNRFNKNGYPNGRGKHRYASSYEDYINEDIFNEYTRNFRNRYQRNRYPLNNNFDYDYSQNPYLDNYDDSDSFDSNYYKGNKYSGQESPYSNLYSDKGYTDLYGNSYSSDFFGDKKKKTDPSNFYVENYNQYVSKPHLNSHVKHEDEHQKPISVFNIFRNENPSKSHNFNRHKLIEDGDVIHIDNYNVFQQGRKGGWKGPKKPLHHLPYRPHRPIKHRRRKPLKWRRPRPFLKRRSSPKKKYHMLNNLNKISRKIPHK